MRGFPGGEARGIALLEGGAADFKGGGEELVVDGPGLLGDNDEAELLVVFEVGVDGVELGCEFGFDVGPMAGGRRSLRMGGVRTAMAKGAVMPLPKTATDSKR